MQDTITNLSSLDMVLEDARSSNKRGDTRNKQKSRLAGLGNQTWLWDPATAVNMSFPGLVAALLALALAWRPVAQVA
ncbi:MAG: hypothetical protein ACKPKO_55225, partial [Candidatus Fonsibacter sp.]